MTENFKNDETYWKQKNINLTVALNLSQSTNVPFWRKTTQFKSMCWEWWEQFVGKRQSVIREL